MRFGLQIPNFTLDGPPEQLFNGVLEIATTAEAAGFDSVWVMPDHFFQLPPLSRRPNPAHAGGVHVAGRTGRSRTSRVKLGALVTGVTYRNPAHLAKIVTTLDVISGGRAILGLGAAWYDVEHEGLGFDFPAAPERLSRLEEALQDLPGHVHRDVTVLRRLLLPDKGSLERAAAPIQSGGPKILIGGGGEKRTLKLVARYGDYCNFFGDTATVAHKVQVLRDHCAAIGRDPAEVTVSRLSTLVLTENDDETAATKDFLRQVAGDDASAYNVGTGDELVAQVEELAAAGVDYFIFNMPTSAAAAVRRVGELLVSRFPD